MIFCYHNASLRHFPRIMVTLIDLLSSILCCIDIRDQNQSFEQIVEALKEKFHSNRSRRTLLSFRLCKSLRNFSFIRLWESVNELFQESLNIGSFPRYCKGSFDIERIPVTNWATRELYEDREKCSSYFESDNIFEIWWIIIFSNV